MDDYPTTKPRKDSPREMRAVFVFFSIAWPVVVFLMGKIAAMSSDEHDYCSNGWQGIALLAVPNYVIVIAIALWFPWSATAEGNTQSTNTTNQP